MNASRIKPDKACIDKLEKMKKEREKYYQEKQEIEERRLNYERTVHADVQRRDKNNGDVFKVLSSIAEIPPGKDVFIKDKRYQNFTFDQLMSNGANFTTSLESLRTLLQLKIMPKTRLSRYDMKSLFYLMSLDQDYIVSESCYVHLNSQSDRWTPKMKHILNVFTNWGATYESLSMTDFDISTVYPSNLPIRTNKMGELPNFCTFNYEHVFCYIKTSILYSNNYSDIQILLLLKMLVIISLDKSNPRILDTIKETRLITVCVSAIRDWDKSKVINITKYIYNENECFHNQIAIATMILPKISRCNALRSCLSFTILRMMILQQKQFKYPHEDKELLDLVLNIKVDNIPIEDLYRLYLIVYLIHSIVRARNMTSGESNKILQKIETHLEALKLDVVRQHKTFDADLLKGRITYCSAMWQLFGNEEKESLL